MSILSILICCDTLVQNTSCPLSWNFSYQNVWDFKEAEWKILYVKCWRNENGRRKADGIFTDFSGCQIILHKCHHPVQKTRSQHMPRDQDATDYEKFCLVSTTLGRKLFYTSSSSLLGYTTVWIFHTRVWKPYQRQLQTSISIWLFLFRYVLKRYLNLAMYHENLVVKCWEYWPGSTSN